MSRQEWIPILYRGGVFCLKTDSSANIFMFISRDLGVFVFSQNMTLISEAPFASVGICDDEYAQYYDCSFELVKSFKNVTMEGSSIRLQFNNNAFTFILDNVQICTMWFKALSWLLTFSKTSSFLTPSIPDISDVSSTKPALKLRIGELLTSEKSPVYQIYHVTHIGSDENFCALLVSEKALSISKEDIKEQIDYFSHLRHPNLVAYVGCLGIDEEDRIWIISEYCEYGNVQDLFNNSHILITENHLSFIAYGIVKALNFLHEQNLLHEAIRADNIYINGSGTCRLGPIKSKSWINLNRTLYERERADAMLYSIGPSERILDGVLCTKSDVWQLGMTLLELSLGQVPFRDASSQELRHILLHVEPLPFSKADRSENFVDFVLACIARDPNDRLSVSELLDHPFLDAAKDDENARKHIMTSMLLACPPKILSRSHESAIIMEKRVTNRATWQECDTKEVKKTGSYAKFIIDEPKQKVVVTKETNAPSEWRVIISPEDINFVNTSLPEGLSVSESDTFIPKDQEWMANISDSYQVKTIFDYHRAYLMDVRMREQSSVCVSKVERRYNDFQSLFDTLTVLYPTYLIPPIPEKRDMVVFKDSLIHERMRGFEWFLSVLAKHKKLSSSAEVAMFLMSDSRTLALFGAKERSIDLKWKEGQQRGRVSDMREQSEEKQELYRPSQPSFWDVMVGDATTVTEYHGERMFDEMFSSVDGLKIQIQNLKRYISKFVNNRVESSVSWYAFPYEMHDVTELNSLDSSWQHFMGACLRIAQYEELHSRQIDMKLVEPLDFLCRFCDSAMDLLDRHGFIVYSTLQTGFVPHKDKKKKAISKQERDILVDELSNGVIEEVQFFNEQHTQTLRQIFLQAARLLVDMEKRKIQIWELCLKSLQNDDELEADDALYNSFATGSWLNM